MPYETMKGGAVVMMLLQVIGAFYYLLSLLATKHLYFLDGPE
jgi:hypothetical protein